MDVTGHPKANDEFDYNTCRIGLKADIVLKRRASEFGAYVQLSTRRSASWRFPRQHGLPDRLPNVRNAWLSESDYGRAIFQPSELASRVTALSD